MTTVLIGSKVFQAQLAGLLSAGSSTNVFISHHHSSIGFKYTPGSRLSEIRDLDAVLNPPGLTMLFADPYHQEFVLTYA
jgi:hypothetical protein